MTVATLPPKTVPRALVPPMMGEAQDGYVERADRALKCRIVDRHSRMSQIFNDWRNSGMEAELQTKANQALAAIAECDPSQVNQHFVSKFNRPVFPEHEIMGPNGQIQRYDRAALAKIVNCCNKRILDTGDLAAMSAGHTPDSEQQAAGMPMPPMVGLTGPFRLGMVGDKEPKWCIFADEHIFKDDYPTVKKMPRRSPEVWMEPDMANRAMDPIAVLGTETPRLDTGVSRFSRKMDPAHYRNVARYSMGAAFPSGSNTFTEKYSDPASGEGNMDPQAIQAIIDSVLQGICATPQWQWLTDQMQVEQNPVPENADAGPTASPTASEGVVDPSNSTGAPADPTAAAAMPTDQAPAEAPAASPASPPATDEQVPPMAGGAPEAPKETQGSDNGDQGATPEELASMKDDEKQQYSQFAPPAQSAYMCARRRHCKSGAMQYSNPVDRERYSRAEAELNTLRGENLALRADRTHRERYSRLSELNQIHDFDVVEEATECKSMTDEQFEKHCVRVVSKYSRRDPSGGMPTLLLEPLESAESVDEVKKEKYSRRAVDIASKSGGKLSWSEALEQAKKEVDRV